MPGGASRVLAIFTRSGGNAPSGIKGEYDIGTRTPEGTKVEREGTFDSDDVAKSGWVAKKGAEDVALCRWAREREIKPSAPEPGR